MRPALQSQGFTSSIELNLTVSMEFEIYGYKSIVKITMAILLVLQLNIKNKYAKVGVSGSKQVSTEEEKQISSHCFRWISAEIHAQLDRRLRFSSE